MSAYELRDGSIADRVMRMCRGRGAISTTMVCEEIEDATRQTLPACLSTGIRMGLIFVRRIEGEPWYDVKPFAAEKGDDDGVDIDRVHTEHAKVPIGLLLSTPPPSAMPMPMPMPPDAEAIKRVATSETQRDFSFGFFSDGRLVLELPSGHTETLPSDQAELLIGFLRRWIQAPATTR